MTRPSRLLAPEGFAAVEESGILLVRADLEGAARALALHAAGSWEEAVASSREGPGRGARGRIEFPGGPVAVAKRMRRGGILAPVWRDRFARVPRLLENLATPREAAARGIATAAPLALFLLEGPPRLWRAWLAVEEIPAAEDLETRLGGGRRAEQDEIAAALSLVRRAHDAGIEHRDLNLGNVLVRRPPSGRPEAFLVDLDRARLHGGPLGFWKRAAAIRRLERSCLKRLGAPGPLGRDPGALLRSLYAAGDPALASRFRALRPLDRALIALHRLRWS